jgi:hypothetical protein
LGNDTPVPKQMNGAVSRTRLGINRWLAPGPFTGGTDSRISFSNHNAGTEGVAIVVYGAGQKPDQLFDLSFVSARFMPQT